MGTVEDAAGALQLNGALLAADRISKGASGGTITFDGGTLRATGGISFTSGVSTYTGLTVINEGELKLDATGSIDNQ